MTKLVEWFESGFTREFYAQILLLPLLLVAAFGFISVGIIAFRVYNFNDCQDAAEELKQQIEEAKEDLKRKGFKFDS
ncbi:hypothetical protein HAZT_HAZT005664 [Hyalella azteca]|uniref:Dolichol-phosphate mannosyltransferase subunit 3 n=1 Tax=Hyalella azteca TaxID=294128 RepID=A0A6A0H5X9_HYAAZ|nr:hypothetical protein HAZT_HAZT005664 [Hyalella azteca]